MYDAVSTASVVLPTPPTKERKHTRRGPGRTKGTEGGRCCWSSPRAAVSGSGPDWSGRISRRRAGGQAIDPRSSAGADSVACLTSGGSPVLATAELSSTSWLTGGLLASSAGGISVDGL